MSSAATDRRFDLDLPLDRDAYVPATKRSLNVEFDQRDLLGLATLGGARAWHLGDEIGTLTVDKQADLAIVDMRAPHLDGFGDPVASTVMGAGALDVETVIVAGEIVKADGVLVGPHSEQARLLMHESRARLPRPS